jgi:hypothetical protein
MEINLMIKYIQYFVLISLFSLQGCTFINLFYASSYDVTLHFHAEGGGGKYDAKAYIDGIEVVNGNYQLSGEPIIWTKYLNLKRGKHHLNAYSTKANIKYETDFDVKGEWTYVLSFWVDDRVSHFKLDTCERGVVFM